MNKCRQSVQRWLEPRARRVEKDPRKKAVRCPKMKINTANRPKKLCQWTDEQMRHAIEAVMSGELGVNHSALQHGVPRTTKLLSTVPSPDQLPTLMLKKKIWLIFLFECSRMEESREQTNEATETRSTEKKKEDRAACKQAERQKAKEEESEEVKSEA